MTSVKIKFRPSNLQDKEGTIYYQVIHARATRRIPTNYHIFSSEWNDKRSSIVVAKDSARLLHLNHINARIRQDITRLNKIIQEWEQGCLLYSTDEIIEEFNRYKNQYSLSTYITNQIVKLKRNKKDRTAETYWAALKSFKTFNNDEDIMLDYITSETMKDYEAWQKGRGLSKNTISFYMRILRAIYNRAVADGVIEDKKPFRDVYTGIDKTVKRALPISAIKVIRQLDLSDNPKIDYARDIFMLSFMLRGMSFIDMAFLKKTDRRDGYIIYRRRKTGQQLIIQWTKEMQEILNKYPENTSDYLLPIIRKNGVKERCAYRNVGYNINHNLKRIAEIMGLTIPLTLYVARHSWASVAKAKGIPVSVISEGLGHDSELTTQIYLASLDTSIIDKANSLILKSII